VFIDKLIRDKMLEENKMNEREVKELIEVLL
jgi:hypothetical protein